MCEERRRIRRYRHFRFHDKSSSRQHSVLFDDSSHHNVAVHLCSVHVRRSSRSEILLCFIDEGEFCRVCSSLRFGASAICSLSWRRRAAYWNDD